MPLYRKDVDLFSNQTVGGEKIFTANTTFSANVVGADVKKSGPLYGIYSQSYSIAGQETDPQDIFFSSDGTKMFIIGNAGNDVTQYTLGTAWDLNGVITHDGQYSVNSQETTPYGLAFDPSGTYMYVVGANDVVYRYTLTTPWDVTGTVTFDQSYSVTSQDTEMRAIQFSSDGTKMFLVGQTNDDVYQYTLTTPWVISSGVSYSGNYSTPTSSDISLPLALTFNSTGTKMWMFDNLYNNIAEFTVVTPWDLNGTVTFEGVQRFLNLNDYRTTFQGLYYNDSNGYLFGVCNFTDRVFRLTTVNNPVLAGEGYHVDGDLFVKKNLQIEKEFFARGRVYAYEISVNGSLTSSFLSAFTTSASATLFTNLSSGSITMGGTAQTGAITIGQSTLAQTISIGSGITAAANTKTINIAAVASSATSITDINIGTLSAGTVSVTLGSSSAASSSVNINGTAVLTTSSASDALRITQTGAGNAIVIEDSTNPDATPFVIDSTGTVVVGSPTAYAIGGTGGTPSIQVHSTTTVFADSAVGVVKWRDRTTNPSTLGGFSMSRSGSSTVGAYTAVSAGDGIGEVRWNAANGTSFTDSSEIAGIVGSGTVGNYVPGEIQFRVAANTGASAPSTAFRIDSTKTASFEDNIVTRGMTKDMGTVYVDKGTQTTGTQTFDYTGGSLQRMQVGGALTIAFSNFPPSGNMGSIQIELVNGGSSTVTWPTINWIKSDGTFTTSVSTYLTDIGRTLQSSGTDFFIFWTRDAGTTVYGKIL